VKHVAMVVLSQYPGDPRVRREAEALARRGVTVDVVCYRNPEQAAVESYGLVTAHRIVTVRDKTSILRYLAFSQGFGLAAFAKLQALSRHRRYDVVQVHNMPDQLVFTALGHRLRGVPVVLDLHDLMVELFESKWNGARARLLLPVVRLVERTSCGFATQLITTSVGFRERLLARGIPAEKVALVLNAADTNIFYRPADGVMARQARRGARLDQPRLVYHGTVARRFGVHVLIEAVVRLRERGLRPQLRIHGKYDADYRLELERLIAAHDLGGAVALGGYLTHEEIREMLYDMDIGVVPYLSDAFMELALSTKSFEYVAMGLPVVASRVAAMTSLFSDASVRYFRPADAADLAAQIAFFCDEPAAREQYAARADEEYAQIAWPVMEARYVELMAGAARTATRSR
jgi:glycosyltransferase involved in cell wall biosynthesis